MTWVPTRADVSECRRFLNAHPRRRLAAVRRFHSAQSASRRPASDNAVSPGPNSSKTNWGIDQGHRLIQPLERAPCRGFPHHFSKSSPAHALQAAQWGGLARVRPLFAIFTTKRHWRSSLIENFHRETESGGEREAVSNGGSKSSR